MKNKILTALVTAMLVSILSGCGDTSNSTAATSTIEPPSTENNTTESSFEQDDYDIDLMSYTADVMIAHNNMLELIQHSTADDVDTAWMAELEGYELDGVKAVRRIENMDVPLAKSALHERVLVYCQEAIDGFQEISNSCGVTTSGDLNVGLDLVYSGIQGLDRCNQGSEDLNEEPQLLPR